MNDRAFVTRVRQLFKAFSVDVWLFGGWAEEVRGLAAPRAHADVDLLYAADDWRRVDALIDARGLDEIRPKRLGHKRAFVLDGTMVELFLVKRDARGTLYTEFWGVRHEWPSDTLDKLGLASRAALESYRTAHAALPNWPGPDERPAA